MLRQAGRVLALRRLALLTERQYGTAMAVEAGQPRQYASDQAKQAIDKMLVVDTLDMAKRFESIGFTREQADRLTSQITEHIILDRMRLTEKFVPKSDLEKVMIQHDAMITSFRAEIMQKQDMHLATLHKDLERQMNFLDKMKSEVRHEMDKMSASQRLDLNLEKGRMRDDLQALRDKSVELELKMDRELNEAKAGIEKAKNDVIKSTIAIFASFSAIAFTMSRLLTM